ncbi:MAG: PQQ-binding-like beta-propeller repeat protein [Planctomycetia bacterium]|nr:PQQ-binding-like beta-propeller repeat protein [Planctomycetia bacterium]
MNRQTLFCGAVLLVCSALVLTISCSAPAPAPPDPQPPVAVVPDPVPILADVGPTDHPMFGGSLSRNMVNLKDKVAKFPTEGPNWDDEESVKKWSADWVLWKATLGSRAYSGPIIAGGKVYVGTNNESPRNKRDTKKNADGEIEPIDKGILMVFDEKTGKFLWQAVHDKLPGGNVTDWPQIGLCSTPTVEGERVYYVSNRCTVVCADVNGFANGNGGDVKNEKYQTETDVDVIWEYDLIKTHDVFPHNAAAGCPLIVGDILFTVTANGVDESHINLPSPLAPSFIAIDKKTGKLLWKSNIPGKNIMHGQWSNPVYGEIGGVKQVIFPGGDGWLYGFVPETGEMLWKFDCNPKWTVYDLGGTGDRSDFIGTPVIHDNKVYIGVGQDPEHSSGIANFYCLSPTKKGDISKFLETKEKGPEGKEKIGEKPNPNSCEVWRYGWEEKRQWSPRDFKFGRTMSTACIVDDIVYISELHGYVHCLDAKTGEHFWEYDTKASIWGSPYFVDGKIFLATDAGDMFVFKHEKKPKKIDAVEAAKDAPDMKTARGIHKAKRGEVEKEYLLAKVEFDTHIRSTPTVANGVLYVMTEKSLYAIKTK